MTYENTVLQQAKTEADSYTLSKQWGRDKQREMLDAGDYKQAKAFEKFVNGSLSARQLAIQYAYKYWTVASINEGITDPYLPKQTMTKKIHIDVGSYIHPENPLYKTMGVRYLESRNKKLIVEDEEYYIVNA